MRLPNGDRVNRDSRIAPNGQLRLTGAADERNKLRAAYYNSNGRTQRYDVGLHGDERQPRVVRRA